MEPARSPVGSWPGLGERPLNGVGWVSETDTGEAECTELTDAGDMRQNVDERVEGVEHGEEAGDEVAHVEAMIGDASATEPDGCRIVEEDAEVEGGEGDALGQGLVPAVLLDLKGARSSQLHRMPPIQMHGIKRKESAHESQMSVVHADQGLLGLKDLDDSDRGEDLFQKRRRCTLRLGHSTRRARADELGEVEEDRREGDERRQDAGHGGRSRKGHDD